MSYRLVNAVLGRDGGPGSSLRGTDRLVLVALASFADASTREAWPSLSRIAQTAGVGLSSVKRGIAAAIEAGEVERVRSGGRDGSTTRYRFVALAHTGPSARSTRGLGPGGAMAQVGPNLGPGWAAPRPQLGHKQINEQINEQAAPAVSAPPVATSVATARAAVARVPPLAAS